MGAQPIEIFAYEKVSMTEWPPLDNLTLAIEPEMPTMGHGSPNNEDPVPSAMAITRALSTSPWAGPGP